MNRIFNQWFTACMAHKRKWEKRCIASSHDCQTPMWSKGYSRVRGRDQNRGYSGRQWSDDVGGKRRLHNEDNHRSLASIPSVQGGRHQSRLHRQTTTLFPSLEWLTLSLVQEVALCIVGSTCADTIVLQLKYLLLSNFICIIVEHRAVHL